MGSIGTMPATKVVSGDLIEGIRLKVKKGQNFEASFTRATLFIQLDDDDDDD